MSPPLVLFDDAVARDWLPMVRTRPAGELLYGISTLRSRVEHALGLDCIGHITRPELAAYDEPWAAPILQHRDLDTAAGLVLLSSRFLPEPDQLPDSPALLVAGDRVVGCRLAPGAEIPAREFFLDPDLAAPDLPPMKLTGEHPVRLWDLIAGNADRIRRDLARADHAALPPDVHLRGNGPVSVGEDVEVAPGVVLDTRDGPIRLDDGVTVEPFTHLRGPAYVGPGTTLLGGPFEAVSIGPVCKAHGEVEETVILGYTNKAHDGFIGHAYIGMWVNLGALTNNSDLKNNYGTVRVWTPAGEVDTGQQKVGCFLGDHVKTAIGTLLNTGSVIETGSNVFGGMPPKYLPPFSWGGPETEYDIDAFLATAANVMARRRVELSDSQRQLLRTAWRLSRGFPAPPSSPG